MNNLTEKKVPYFEVQALSNSALSTFNYDVESYYKAYVQKVYEPKESDSLLLGSLVHMLLLEPEKINDTYAILPKKIDGKMGIFIEEYVKTENAETAYAKAEFKVALNTVMTNLEKQENQNYYNALLNTKDKILVDLEDFNKAKRLRDSVEKANQIPAILEGLEWDRFTEFEIYFEIERHGKTIQAKSKLDDLYISKCRKFVKYVDHKTDSKNRSYEYLETFKYWKTYRQLAFYEVAIRHYFMQQGWDQPITISHYINAISLKNEKSMLYTIDNSFISKGLGEIQEDISKLIWHMDNNLWEYPKHIYDQLELNKTLNLIYEESN